MSESDLITDLGSAIRDTIDNYCTGHDIPVELLVGLLHCIAHEVMIEMDFYELGDEDEDDLRQEEF